MSGVSEIDRLYVAEVLTCIETLTDAWGHLRLDTPADQARHERLVGLTRRAIVAARTRIGTVDAATPPEPTP